MTLTYPPYERVTPLPPMPPVDARTAAWMAEHRDPDWGQRLAAAFE